MRPVMECINCRCIFCIAAELCDSCDGDDDGGGKPTIHLVIVPLHVIFISGNTIVLVTDIILVIL